MKRINEYLELDGEKSLFEQLSEYQVPWKDDIDAKALELMYLSHSGLKYAGYLFDNVDGDVETIANTLYTIYKQKWYRLWDVAVAEYEPLENYNMIESGDITESEKEKSTGESTGSATGNNGNSLYGFASTTKVSSDENESESATASSSTGESDRTAERKHTLTRNGNIGIRSSQELLTQEIELWKWTFADNLFQDIDKILALEIY